MLSRHIIFCDLKRKKMLYMKNFKNQDLFWYLIKNQNI
jgi:hypothetical protein